MECSHCSAQISPAAHFCPSCGVPVDQPSSALDHKPNQPVAKTQNKHFPPRKLALIFSAITMLIVVLTYLLLLPRMNSLSSLKQSKILLVETSNKTGKLNQSLEAMYNYVTAASQATDESSVSTMNSAIFINEAAETTNPVPSLYFLKEEIEQAVEALKNKQVKGFSTPKDDPLKSYRDLRDLSVNAQTTASDGLHSVGRFSSNNKSASAHLAKLSPDLEKVAEESQIYLSEGKKTAIYYQTYTDAYVDLSGLIIGSLQASNIKKIADNLEEAKQIHTDMTEISESELPDEIGDFHNDILTEIRGALEFLTTFSKAAASNDAKSTSQAAAAAQKWIAEEKELLLKIQTDQVNFWKKNSAFAKYDFLESSQNELVKNLEEETKSNSFLFIR